jgi:hypothetical protein
MDPLADIYCITKLVGMRVTLCTSILEVVGSIPCRDPDCSFCQPPQADARIVPRIGDVHILPNPSLFITGHHHNV